MHPASSPTHAKIIHVLRSTGVLPVFHHADTAILSDVLRIADRCGVRAIEFLDQRDRRSLRSFATLAKEPGGENVLLGAGAVRDVRAAEFYIRAGAKFIASPFLNPDVARLCQQHHVPWIPGCSSTEEAGLAKAWGAAIATVLPSTILGPSFLKKMTTAHPELCFIPSAGISLSENNLYTWFDAGAICVRLGEPLFGREKDSMKIEQQLYRSLQQIKQINATLHKLKPVMVP